MILIVPLWLLIGTLLIFALHDHDADLRDLEPPVGRRLALLWVLLVGYPAYFVITLVVEAGDYMSGAIPFETALRSFTQTVFSEVYADAVDVWNGR